MHASKPKQHGTADAICITEHRRTSLTIKPPKITFACLHPCSPNNCARRVKGTPRDCYITLNLDKIPPTYKRTT